MKFIARLYQAWLRRFAPAYYSRIFRILYGSNSVCIGPGLLCDGLPRCLLDSSARLDIGSNVEFRSGVELRIHGNAHLVIEDGVRVDRGVRILVTNGALVRIGAGTRIGLYSVINGGASIDIGHKSLISGFVYLQSSMHSFSNSNTAISDQGYKHAPVILKEGVWLGSHVVIMPGRTVGAYAVVGSNAVVTKDVAPGAVVGGVPASQLNSERDSTQP
ncbi:acyltransferase [Sphingomonas sp. Root710]|uniref:acyltransferase n=1 Tax=Sphingomonas sp. Root710 TaxID=1736594 RepID=UPI0009E7531D|nr:acyltransferase [Sphingomonas sp. Root710]